MRNWNAVWVKYTSVLSLLFWPILISPSKFTIYCVRPSRMSPRHLKGSSDQQPLASDMYRQCSVKMPWPVLANVMVYCWTSKTGIFGVLDMDLIIWKILIGFLTGIPLFAHICATCYRDLVYQDNTTITQPHMAKWSITASDEAILTNEPGFESGETQLQFEVQVTSITCFL